jgi:hypothetical protein
MIGDAKESPNCSDDAGKASRGHTRAEASTRFFYHSFPRRGRGTDDEIEKGCKILALICDAGLVLAPEVVKWSYPHADGSPPRDQQTIQRRICFTELALHELSGHAQEFGHFALEFDVKTLKRLGAMPVFYIPQATAEDASETASLGSTLVVQSIDALILAMRLAGVKKLVDDPMHQGPLDCTFGFEKLKTFRMDARETRRFLDAFTYALTPPDMLEHALTGLLSCFYPADNLRDNKALAYYRQREWRIAWNFAVRGEDVMRRPSQELIQRLLAIDADFFGRDFPTASGVNQLAAEAYVLPGIGGERIIELVNRVIVPRAALTKAKEIAAKTAPNTPVVCIEDMG